ncbi:MAG: hypothetical protein ACRCZF_14690, partial [Gemmataceae bacterium]
MTTAAPDLFIVATSALADAVRTSLGPAAFGTWIVTPRQWAERILQHHGGPGRLRTPFDSWILAKCQAEELRTDLQWYTSNERLSQALQLWSNNQRGPFAAARNIHLRGNVDPLLIEQLKSTSVDVRLKENPEPSLGQRLAESLFKPQGMATVPPTAVQLIEAAGALGEARLIARQVRQLLHAGHRPTDILIISHQCTSIDRNAFREAGLALSTGSGQPLADDPNLSLLMRAWQLPDNDFNFPEVAAILRSSLLPPSMQSEALAAEQLLRELDEPTGRDAMLATLDRWVHNPPQPLEDEAAEQKRFVERSVRAKQSAPFLNHFFCGWVEPGQSVREHALQLDQLARHLGIHSSPSVERFLHALHQWVEEECPRLPVAGRLFADRFAFTQAAKRLAETLRQDSPQQGIRWLAPEQATSLTAPIVILAQLTETSFPRIRSAASALEDLAAEQALFRELIGCCTQQLILSFPATDPRGQQLLPSSFLSDLIRRFPTGSIPTTRQRMLT